MYPDALPEPVDERIPEKIRKDLEEANRDRATGSYRSAVVMARRALQLVCLDKGAPKTFPNKKGEGSHQAQLWEQVDWLFEQGIITKNHKDWAHQVRAVGNDGAHPADAEDNQEVTSEEADDVLALLGQFTANLYVTESIYRERKAARETSSKRPQA
jgi:hypothetical protein